MYFRMAAITIGNLFRKPATLMHPFKKRIPFKATRGQISIMYENCNLCTICAKKCPSDAITVDRENKSWSIEHLRCIVCGACVEACPKKSLIMKTDYRAPATADESKNLKEVHKSA